jgi:hypothetical protein
MSGRASADGSAQAAWSIPEPADFLRAREPRCGYGLTVTTTDAVDVAGVAWLSRIVTVTV